MVKLDAINLGVPEQSMKTELQSGKGLRGTKLICYLMDGWVSLDEPCFNLYLAI